MIHTSVLDSKHYAASWPIPKENEFNDLAVVNQAGINYALTPDGPEREAQLLVILKYFHGYLYKYVDMIVRGHLPSHKYNGDTKALLRYFLPKGQTINRLTLSTAVKHLHLAFPNQNPSEIYDILTLLLLRAIKKYDPHYTDKVKEVVNIVNKLPKKKKFTFEQIFHKTAPFFDPTGQLRLLARNGFLVSIKGAGKKLVGYKTKHWPPDPKFLSSGPIGFSYVIQNWFRYYLQDYINEQMKTIEARGWDDMLQLDHRTDITDPNNPSFTTEDIPHADGNVMDEFGQNWAADTELMHKSWDLSNMTKEWVDHTDDKLFKNMTKIERSILYLYYTQELPWKGIAARLNMSVNQVQKIHTDVLLYLKDRFGVKSTPILTSKVKGNKKHALNMPEK